VHASTGACASIVIPTRARPDYLAVALASIAPQAQRAGAEVVVVDDAGPNAITAAAVRSLAERHGARYEPHPAPLGLNVARNTGVACTTSELIVFVDDDVQVAPGWLEALLQAAADYPHAEVFAGRIHARLEGRPPHSCGREAPPVTTLDLGTQDTTAVRCAWGANMTVRRRALQRVGPFDTTLEHGGDEQEWQERLLAQQEQLLAPQEPTAPPLHTAPCAEPVASVERQGLIVYIAAAALYHRRCAGDARLRSLSRTAHARGRAARRFDARRDRAPTLRRESATLLGCFAHVVRRRCPAGLVMAAHSIGRLQEGLRERRS
jgi:hypothetical protein